jgi:tetratricopeptide (TPR) repeat protein
MKPYIIFITSLMGIFFFMTGLTAAWTSRDRYRYYHDKNKYGHYPYSSPFYKKYRSPVRTYRYNYRSESRYTLSHGWDLLKKGRSHTALDVFSKIAESYPESGEPKLGYAIAAAESGQLSKAVWAMRRALEYDSQFFRLFSMDVRLERKITHLTGKYRGHSHGLEKHDAHFMIASLHYLLGNRQECLQAIEKIKKANDYSPSARNLYHLAETF